MSLKLKQRAVTLEHEQGDQMFGGSPATTSEAGVETPWHPLRFGRRGLAAAITGVSLVVLARIAGAEAPVPFDAAQSFGARQSLWDLNLSPDGTQVAYLVPVANRGTALITAGRGPEAKLRVALSLDGKPLNLKGCSWVANDRLVCQIYGVIRDSSTLSGTLPVSRWVAVNADGSNPQTLSAHRNEFSRGYFLYDGDIIDYLPDEDGAVLMSRNYTPDAHLGSRVGSDTEGLGVDWLDTRTLKTRSIIAPRKDAFRYLSDGRGTVRVMGQRDTDSRGYERARLTFYYRPVGSTDWRKLSQYDQGDDSGFWPVAIDPDLNVAYGIRRTDGRACLYTIKLDDSLAEHLVYSRPDVDVIGLLEIGRRRRIVGATYVTDRSQTEVFDPDIKRLLASLARALPEQPLLGVTDSSVDESTVVVAAGSDSDPGVYYLFDRSTHKLDVYKVMRRELEGVKLATMKFVSYPSGDGVMIPAYLTLPPGKENAHGLPAIVLPHGGPNSRDEWGFDWLPQFYAHRGYAVLQPQFRGSAGYGDAWFQQNGFRSWRAAIDDVLAAGRWLVKEGIADPSQLGILGWSYGGYAALQSAVVDPSLFKAVVAVAPVTDLPAFVEDHREFEDFVLVRKFVGEGPHTHDGSPIEHVKNIKIPVLLFHGTNDRNVSYQQSKLLAEKLQSAGGGVELVTFMDLDHQLDDASARAELLRRSDEFLRSTFQLSAAGH